MAKPNKMTEGNSRFCIYCDQRKFLKDFDPRKVRKGMMVCKGCSEEVKQFEKAREEQKKDTAERKAVVKNAVTANLKYEDVSEMCKSILEKHGGIDGFCNEWHAALIAAKQKDPGSKTVLDHYEKISRLHLAMSQSRPPAVDVGDMSDEELELEIEEFARRVGEGG